VSETNKKSVGLITSNGLAGELGHRGCNRVWGGRDGGEESERKRGGEFHGMGFSVGAASRICRMAVLNHGHLYLW
jgi:hypothetical protein